MSPIRIDQALWQRDPGEPPRLLGGSQGLNEDWQTEMVRMVVDFGIRPSGVTCPLAIVVQPLDRRHVTLFQVADLPASGGGLGLGFRFLVLERRAYEYDIGDPFWLADKLPPEYHLQGELPVITWEEPPPPPRTVEQLRAVLRRVKAHALQEGEDPHAPDFQHTEANAESPALLGGVQVLVDGGRLIFERPQPDPDLVRNLWLLLANRTRGRLYPATFVFAADLPLDVLVVPDLAHVPLEGITTEEMAADYPAGSYELALQTAVEAADQASLDTVLNRRDSAETFRLALFLLVGMFVLVVLMRVVFPERERSPQIAEQAAAAAGMVAAQDPWTILGLRIQGHELFKPR